MFQTNHAFKKNHVCEWVSDTATGSGEPAEGNTTIPVQLKQNIRLETLAEREERQTAYAEAKRIDYKKRARFLVLDCSSHGCRDGSRALLQRKKTRVVAFDHYA